VQIAAVARRHAHTVAVEDGERRVTYAELVSRASDLAVRIGRAAPASRPVAVMLPRGADFVIAALAAMTAANGYLPIDQGEPPSRVALLLADSGASVVVGDRDRVTEGVPRLDVVPSGAGDAAPPTVTGRDLAYVIFTSGTSGRPKGVVVRQDNLANLVRWHNQAYRVGPGTRALHTAGLSFDAAVWEIWPYLCAGATVVVTPDQERSLPSRLVEFAAGRRIDIAFLSTPLAEELVHTPGLTPPWRLLLTGGDALRVMRMPEGYRLVNHYGPTEATVVTTAGEVLDGPGDGLVPIGRPIDGAVVRLCDEALEQVPDGDTGEVLIGGAGVADGYLGRPDLTAQRFVTLTGAPGRWYRTGDRACRLPDGRLRFRGRIDGEQLKVRGMRVEAGEVEAAVLCHPALTGAAVAAVGESSRGTRLIALVVPHDAMPPSRELRRCVAATLPRHLVPDAFVPVGRLPLTSNGKLDRDAVAALARRSSHPSPAKESDDRRH
jgi:amino acid adenylation domain-containing protein